MHFVFLLKINVKVRHTLTSSLNNWVIKKGRNSRLKSRKTDVKKCGHIAHQLNSCFVSDLSKAIKDGFIEYPTCPPQTSSSPSKTQFFNASSITAIWVCLNYFFLHLLIAAVTPYVTWPIKRRKSDVGGHTWSWYYFLFHFWRPHLRYWANLRSAK